MDVETLAREAHPHYRLVPVGAGSKVSLTHWDERDFGLRELLHHVRRGGNLAARVGQTRSAVRAVVVDRDSRDRETWRFLLDHGLQRSNQQVETASGNWHLWFGTEVEGLRSRIKLAVGGKKIAVDFKATGYVLLPGSVIGGRAYRFRESKGLKKPEDLVPLPGSFLELLEDNRPRPSVNLNVNLNVNPGGRLAYRGRKYVDTFERRAVSGQGGHTSLFVAALKIVRFVRALGGSERDCWDLLLYFNATKADPPWDPAVPADERALRHKLEDALKCAK